MAAYDTTGESLRATALRGSSGRESSGERTNYELPADLKADAIRVRDTIDAIMLGAAAGELYFFINTCIDNVIEYQCILKR